MQTHRRTFANGKQPFDTGFTLLVGFNPAHGVVCGWTHRNRLFYRIDANVGFREFTDKRQTFKQLFLTQMAQIEIDHIASRRRDRVALAPFVPESTGDFIARTQLHIFIFRFAQRCFRTHAVILQVAVAVLVDQNTAFAAAAFRHQNTGARQAGGVVLHELHIAQRYAVAERHTHPVAGDDTAVGIVAIHASSAAGSQNYRVGADLHQRTFHHIHRDQTASLPIIDQNIQNKMFVEALDLRELKRGLEQGVQHMKAGFIGSEPVRSIFMPPNRRTLTLPSGRRLHGHPHCSSWVISVGQ